jgi:hypothetical protein
MSFRPATPAETKSWDEWLWKSHGIRKLPGANVHHCDLDYPMLFTPIKTLDHLVLRLERETGQPVMSFCLHGNIRTIAAFWSIPGAPRMAFSGLRQVEVLRCGLVKSAAEGRVWWGTEYPPESTITTTMVCWFPQTFPLPHDVNAALNLDPPIERMETSLELA